jgi:hypothetical protein
MTDATEQPVMGFKDMHPDQLTALVQFIDMALTVTPDDVFDDVFNAAEDLVVLLGGVGIEVTYGVST